MKLRMTTMIKVKAPVRAIRTKSRLPMRRKLTKKNITQKRRQTTRRKYMNKTSLKVYFKRLDQAKLLAAFR